MKNITLFLITFLTLTISVTAQTDQENIQRFEKILGKEKTESLNMLVNDFEKYLVKTYPKSNIEEAYLQFLKDIKNDTFDWNNFDFQTKQTKEEFRQSGLKKDLYQTGSESGLQINRLGNYMKAIYHTKDEADKLIKKYYEVREAAGIIQNELFASIILTNEPDFSNYFHKRFVVVEFSY